MKVHLIIITFASATGVTSPLRIAYRRKDARVVEEARLESVYTPKGYLGFESPSFRFYVKRKSEKASFFCVYNQGVIRLQKGKGARN